MKDGWIGSRFPPTFPFSWGGVFGGLALIFYCPPTGKEEESHSKNPNLHKRILLLLLLFLFSFLIHHSHHHLPIVTTTTMTIGLEKPVALSSEGGLIGRKKRRRTATERQGEEREQEVVFLPPLEGVHVELQTIDFMARVTPNQFYS
jgi:hypothetical protein